MVFGLPLDILESTFFKTLISNVDIHPTEIAVRGFNPGGGYTNVDGVQVFCTTPGNVSTCRRVNAPSPKRAPQQTVNVSTPTTAEPATVTPVPSTIGTQARLQSAVTTESNPLKLIRQPASPSWVISNRAFAGNPFAFLFR